jgi:hypothetical protein
LANQIPKFQVSKLTGQPVIEQDKWVRLGLDNLELSLADSAIELSLQRTDADHWEGGYSLAGQPQGQAKLTAEGTKLWQLELEPKSPTQSSTEIKLEKTDQSLRVEFNENRPEDSKVLGSDYADEPDSEAIILTKDCYELVHLNNPTNTLKRCQSDDEMGRSSSNFTGLQKLQDMLPGMPRPEWLLGVTAIKTDGSWNISLIQSLLGVGVTDF